MLKIIFSFWRVLTPCVLLATFSASSYAGEVPHYELHVLSWPTLKILSSSTTPIPLTEHPVQVQGTDIFKAMDNQVRTQQLGTYEFDRTLGLSSTGTSASATTHDLSAKLNFSRTRHQWVVDILDRGKVIHTLPYPDLSTMGVRFSFTNNGKSLLIQGLSSTYLVGDLSEPKLEQLPNGFLGKSDFDSQSQKYFSVFSDQARKSSTVVFKNLTTGELKTLGTSPGIPGFIKYFPKYGRLVYATTVMTPGERGLPLTDPLRKNRFATNLTVMNSENWKVVSKLSVPDLSYPDITFVVDSSNVAFLGLGTEVLNIRTLKFADLPDGFSGPFLPIDGSHEVVYAAARDQGQGMLKSGPTLVRYDLESHRVLAQASLPAFNNPNSPMTKTDFLFRSAAGTKILVFVSDGILYMPSWGGKGGTLQTL